MSDSLIGISLTLTCPEVKEKLMPIKAPVNTPIKKSSIPLPIQYEVLTQGIHALMHILEVDVGGDIEEKAAIELLNIITTLARIREKMNGPLPQKKEKTAAPQVSLAPPVVFPTPPTTENIT